MTAPRTTAQILAAPLVLELLRAVADGQVSAVPGGYLLYGAIRINSTIRSLAIDELVLLPAGQAPMLTARGEDILALA
jgi:hypothetical protein